MRANLREIPAACQIPGGRGGARRGTAVRHRIGAGTANPGGCSSTRPCRAANPIQSKATPQSTRLRGSISFLFLPTSTSAGFLLDFPQRAG